MVRSISILGSTGSVGRQAVEVARRLGIAVRALTANNNIELLERQASRYKEIFDVFKEQAKKGNLSMVVFWGMGDNDSWLDDFPIQGRGDAALLFDRKLQAKPAYYAITKKD